MPGYQRRFAETRPVPGPRPRSVQGFGKRGMGWFYPGSGATADSAVAASLTPAATANAAAAAAAAAAPAAADAAADAAKPEPAVPAAAGPAGSATAAAGEAGAAGGSGPAASLPEDPDGEFRGSYDETVLGGPRVINVGIPGPGGDAAGVGKGWRGVGGGGADGVGRARRRAAAWAVCGEQGGPAGLDGGLPPTRARQPDPSHTCARVCRRRQAAHVAARLARQDPASAGELPVRVRKRSMRTGAAGKCHARAANCRARSRWSMFGEPRG